MYLQKSIIKHSFIPNHPNCDQMKLIFKPLLFIVLYSVIMSFFSCSTRDKLETSGTDNTGKLHSVRKRLYERKDTKISISEHKGHDDFIDTLTINPEEGDTLLFKTPDVSLSLLSKDLNSEDAKFSRVIIKNKVKSIFKANKTPIKLSKDSYLSVAYLCNNKGVVLKNRHSIKVRNFKVIDDKIASIDKTQKMIFINRPLKVEKGQILFDFILVNTSLSEDDLLVKIKIDGADFYAEKWIPFVIHGLKNGKHKIEVSLVNKDDEPLSNFLSKDMKEFEVK